jgi:GTP-binding protein
VALNKLDLLADRSELAALEAELRRRGCEVFGISGATGEGVPELLRAVVRALEAAEAAAPAAAAGQAS